MLLTLGSPPGLTRRPLSPAREESLQAWRVCRSSGHLPQPSKSSPPVMCCSSTALASIPSRLSESTAIYPLRETPDPLPPDLWKLSQPPEPPDPPPAPPDPPDPSPLSETCFKYLHLLPSPSISSELPLSNSSLNPCCSLRSLDIIPGGWRLLLPIVDRCYSQVHSIDYRNLINRYGNFCLCHGCAHYSYHEPLSVLWRRSSRRSLFRSTKLNIHSFVGEMHSSGEHYTTTPVNNSSTCAGGDPVWARPNIVSCVAELLRAWPTSESLVFNRSSTTSFCLFPWYRQAITLILNPGNLSSSSHLKKKLLQLSSLARERHSPISSLKRERSTPPSSLLRERSFPFSSLSRERTLPFSISLRDVLSLESKPKKLSKFLTMLFLCLKVCFRTKDASMNLQGKDWFSKSHVKVTQLLISGYAVKSPSTHSEFTLSSLTSYPRTLCAFCFYALLINVSSLNFKESDSLEKSSLLLYDVTPF